VRITAPPPPEPSYETVALRFTTFALGTTFFLYRQQCFGFFTLLEHIELTLGREGKARRQALAKARRLVQDASTYDAEPDRT
jgi:hypothetical protein